MLRVFGSIPDRIRNPALLGAEDSLKHYATACSNIYNAINILEKFNTDICLTSIELCLDQFFSITGLLTKVAYQR